MPFAESSPSREEDPRLASILDQYGDVLVLDHEGAAQPLSQATDACPPLVGVLLKTETPEQLEEVVNSLRAPE